MNRTERDVPAWASDLGESQVKNFWDRVEKTSTCWLWTGHIHTFGYGTFYISRRFNRQRAHRVSWFIAHGGFVSGLVLDHICRVRHCVNPDHLREVTDRENVLAGVGVSATQARRTHCDKGHQFTPENTYLRKGGARKCMTCAREWDRRRRERMAARKASALAGPSATEGTSDE